MIVDTIWELMQEFIKVNNREANVVYIGQNQYAQFMADNRITTLNKERLICYGMKVYMVEHRDHLAVGLAIGVN